LAPEVAVERAGGEPGLGQDPLHLERLPAAALPHPPRGPHQPLRVRPCGISRVGGHSAHAVLLTLRTVATPVVLRPEIDHLCNHATHVVPLHPTPEPYASDVVAASETRRPRSPVLLAPKHPTLLPSQGNEADPALSPGRARNAVFTQRSRWTFQRL